MAEGHAASGAHLPFKSRRNGNPYSGWNKATAPRLQNNPFILANCRAKIHARAAIGCVVRQRQPDCCTILINPDSHYTAHLFTLTAAHNRLFLNTLYSRRSGPPTKIGDLSCYSPASG